MTYDVTNKKLQYAVNTQFNYFKFPPRIKNISINDAINVDEVLGDLDIVSGRYTVSETIGMPPEDGSDKLVYRAGSFDESNSSDYYMSPNLNPAGYKLYKGSLDKQDHGGWVIPTKLDMGSALSGNEFLKPSTFIVTPDLIDAGENIFFKIQVAVRISLAEAWMDLQRSADPTSETADLNTWLNIEKDSAMVMYTPNYSNIQPVVVTPPPPIVPSVSSIGAQTVGTSYGGQAGMMPVQVQYSNYFNQVAQSYQQAQADKDAAAAVAFGTTPSTTPSTTPTIALNSSMKIQNSVLIELNMRRIDDLPDIKNTYYGALAGTFINGANIPPLLPGTLPNLLPENESVFVGYDDSKILESLLVDISVADQLYRTNLNLYNNLVSQIGDRSTNTQIAELESSKIQLDYSEALVIKLTLEFEQIQVRLKENRLIYLRDNVNPEIPPIQSSYPGASTGIYRYDVQKMTPVSSNLQDMLYTIHYMIDIKAAKPYDEYFITTAAGSPYNMIYKRNTVWDVAPQSKLTTIL
jgi:hypothetical protein